MGRRSLPLACVLACCLVLPAGAVEETAPPRGSPAVGLAAYRTYARAQAELLVRMLRVLARDIGDGNLEAAQNDYPMTRKYLERIRPLLARQDDPGRETDPVFSGFARIEHGLFAQRSTQGLATDVDGLQGDVAKLAATAAIQPMRMDLLLDGPAALLETVTARVATGGREPYAQTDLWDIEANIDGAREIVAAVRPQIEARDPLLMPRVTAAFDAADARLSQLRDGCGFKAFDQLTRAEKAELGEATATLARELAKLRTVPAID